MNCLFDLIYTDTETPEIIEKRIELGHKLYQFAPTTSDIVVPIPETANYIAQGFSNASKIPLTLGIYKSRPKPRTLFINQRAKTLYEIMTIISSLVDKKSITLVDESVISGVTLMSILTKLILVNINLKNIDIRVATVMVKQCPYKYKNKLGLPVLSINPSFFSLVNSFKTIPPSLIEFDGCKECFGVPNE